MISDIIDNFKNTFEQVKKNLQPPSDDEEEKNQEEEEEEEEQKKKQKKKGGSCGGGSNQGDQSSYSAPKSCDGTSPSELGDVGLEDVDESTNSMCKKVYTVYRCI